MASAELRAFLAGIAVDPERLGAFMRDPDAALAASDLDEEDKVAVRSGNYATLLARLDNPIMYWQLFYPFGPSFQAFSKAFSEAFSEAFPEAFSKALSQAFRQTFPPAFPDVNADTSDAGPVSVRRRGVRIPKMWSAAAWRRRGDGPRADPSK